jgi:hypothetical protein
VIITAPLCSGGAFDVALSAHGGRAPYAWSAVFDDVGFAFVSDGKTATLSGASVAAGEYGVEVRVSDADQRSHEHRLTLRVNATPVITTKIPAVCADEVYSVELKAEGGDASKYRWSSSLPSDTGLRVTGARLEGRFGGWPVAVSSVPFTLSLESEGCAAEPVELLLTAAPRSECPVISIEGSLPALPPPCAGSAYSARLQAAGGDASHGYTWRTVDAPQGLAIDASTGVVSGIAQAAGVLHVEVEDGVGRTIAAEYSLEPRTQCWLAYLAEDDGPTQLHLFDALLGNRQAFSAGTAGAAVADFQFSPDGRFLAYRAGVAPGVHALALVELATMQERVVGFDDVREYAWSQDSATLAVAYAASGAPVVGGLRVRAPGAASSEMFSELQPIAADVRSRPVWFGSSQLAFLESIGHPVPYAAMTELGEHGFSDPQLHYDSFFPDTRMQPAARGFFAIPKDHFVITFYPADGSPGKLHGGVLVSPSGRYTALAHGGGLRIFRDVDDSLFFPDEVAAYRSAAGCDRLLAWGESRDRIACLHSADGTTGVNLFELDEQTAELSGPFPMRMGDHAVSLTELQSRRRVFSRSGGRFAFASKDRLYIAKVIPTDSVIDFDYMLPVADAELGDVLVFSPDERMLLEHRGTHLSLFRFESLIQEALLTNRVAPAPPCGEYGYSAEGQYCGETGSRTVFAWSPDSALIAIATPPGALTVLDVRSLDDGMQDVAATTRCSGDCVATDHFAFQP